MLHDWQAAALTLAAERPKLTPAPTLVTNNARFLSASEDIVGEGGLSCLSCMWQEVCCSTHLFERGQQLWCHLPLPRSPAQRPPLLCPQAAGCGCRASDPCGGALAITLGMLAACVGHRCSAAGARVHTDVQVCVGSIAVGAAVALAAHVEQRGSTWSMLGL